MLAAYVQAGPPDQLQIWVGIFDNEHPAAPELTVNGRRMAAQVVAPLHPIRDSMLGPGGRPINHRTIVRLDGREAGTPYDVKISAAGETISLATKTLPKRLPATLEGTFNVLLCSCYSQPEDASGLLGTVVSQIMQRPDLTLMLGDQIYGDLPIMEDLPDDDAGVAQTIGEKYRRNWLSLQLESGGLATVLGRAPVLCVADDHEYWNNYPYQQKQLPKTWEDAGRKQWRKVATALYEDYQLAGQAGGTQRVDIDPLKIITVDMRSGRDEDFERLVCSRTMREIHQWADEIVKAKQAGEPAFGLFTSGQALFTTPTEESRRKSVDAELGNYTQFAKEIVPVFDRLAAEHIPVIYVTGDVHWGRISHAIDSRSGRVAIYEVIASPSRLIRIPVVDAAKEAAAWAGGIFGKAKPWPRHSDADPVPPRLSEAPHFRIERDLDARRGHAQRGDHVAVMSFAAAGGGLDFTVSYYPISEDKVIGAPQEVGPFELRIN
jgi:hypothetical protein